MKLDEIKTKLNNYVGKSVLIKYNLGRNKYEEYEAKIKELTAAKSRCIPFEQENIGDTCVCCGRPATKMVIWGRQY